MCRVTEKLGADMTETERTALMKIASEMRCALTIVKGASHILTQYKQSKKAGRFLRVLTDGVERLTHAVQAAEEFARTSRASDAPVDTHEGGG